MQSPDLQRFTDTALGLIRPELVPHPRSTTEFFGHQPVEQAFLESLASGREQHALILHGPKGIGKATFAYRIARYLIAQGAEPADSLDIDPADDPGIFARVREGTEQRLQVAQREAQKSKTDSTVERLSPNISVDSVREAIRFLHLTAVAGSWRVLIIDAAEDLNESGANALLKSLEEPPPQTMVLLVSHAPDRLLPTIMSRCRKLAMRPLDPSDVQAATRAAARGTALAAAKAVLDEYHAAETKRQSRTKTTADDGPDPTPEVPSATAVADNMLATKQCELWQAVAADDAMLWRLSDGSVSRTLAFAFMGDQIHKIVEGILQNFEELDNHVKKVTAGQEGAQLKPFITRRNINALTELLRGTDLKQEQLRELTADVIERRLADLARHHSSGGSGRDGGSPTALLANIWASAAYRFRQHIDTSKSRNIDPELTLATALITAERSALLTARDAAAIRTTTTT